MPLRITYCKHCAKTSPEFMKTLDRLQREHPNELRTVQLECMASCDEAPVAMVEYDFFSRIEPDHFYEHVTAKLAAQESE